MDAQDFRSLQEAYSQVYQVDEALGDAIDRAREKSAKKGDFAASARYRASYRQTKHGFDAPGKKATRQGIDKETGEPRPGNKWRRRAGKGGEIERNRDTFDENYDLYDIILTHLLDEGYADTQEAALKIMANMSEEWRQSIVEAVQIPPIGKPQRYISPSRPIPTSSTPIPDRSTPEDKKIGQKISQTPAGMRLTGPTGPLR